LQNVEKRLITDTQFKRAVEELAYTKRLLRAMPKIRAPHNFMLSPEQVKKTSKHQFFQPAWGFVSAVSTFLLLAVFVGTSLLPRLGVLQSAAPEMAPVANDAAMTQKTEGVVTAPPMIILWNPQRAYGMGGGGSGQIGGGDGTGGAEGSGLPGSTTIMQAPSTPMPILPGAYTTPTFAPEAPATEPLRQGQPSNVLILGIPDEKSQGNFSSNLTKTRVNLFAQFPPTVLLMAGLGLIALVSAGLAIFLRRR
jgi:hypothetical protein